MLISGRRVPLANVASSSPPPRSIARGRGATSLASTAPLASRGGATSSTDMLVISGRQSAFAQRSPSPHHRRTSSLLLEVSNEQQKAIERLADYPRRVERLKQLWSDIAKEVPSPKPSRRGSRPSGAAGSSGALAASGVSQGPLTAAQIRELMSRDLTPEDYELLLLLDEGVKKRAKTLSEDAAAALPFAPGSDWLNEECGICLCALEADEDVRMLPACGHLFHAPCAQRWLVSSKASCPLCGREEATQENVFEAFRRFDDNGDGLFEVAEMKKVLAALDPDTWDSDSVDSLFQVIDTKKTGRIKAEEFVTWVFGTDACSERQRLRDVMNI